jgi:hypothetical protein
MRSIWLAAFVTAGSAWIATAVQAKAEIGFLACTLSEPTAGERATTRDALCTFKMRNGAQETYVGKVQAVNLSARDQVTLVWRVRVPPVTPVAPGFLEQRYAADPRTPANHLPDLVGQANSAIILQSMTDKMEGSASVKERSPAGRVGVLGIELDLKSTTG